MAKRKSGAKRRKQRERANSFGGMIAISPRKPCGRLREKPVTERRHKPTKANAALRLAMLGSADAQGDPNDPIDAVKARGQLDERQADALRSFATLTRIYTIAQKTPALAPDALRSFLPKTGGGEMPDEALERIVSNYHSMREALHVVHRRDVDVLDDVYHQRTPITEYQIEHLKVALVPLVEWFGL